MKYSPKWIKSQYYRIVNQGKGAQLLVLTVLLLASILGVKNIELRANRQTESNYSIQGVTSGTLILDSSNSRSEILYLSPYNDFYTRKDTTTQRIKVPVYKNILSYDLFSLFLAQKNTTFLNHLSSQKIVSKNNNKVSILKTFKISTKEEVVSISNGIKYSQKSLIFDNYGNFYSEGAEIDDLKIMDSILKSSNKLYSQDLYFNNASKVYIYNPLNKALIVFSNDPSNLVTIDPAYQILYIKTSSVREKNNIKTVLNFEFSKINDQL